ETLELIAFEKAGILKSGVPAVFSAQHPEAARVLEEQAKTIGSPVEWATGYQVVEEDAAGSRLCVRGIELDCPLPGTHQAQNAATAAVALARLGIAPQAIQKGIAATRWPGRLELVAREPDIYLDGAHNPAGARTLLGYIQRFHTGRKVWMIFGAMRDKAIAEIGQILFPAASEIVFTAPAQKRSVEPAGLLELGPRNARVAYDVAEAIAVVRAEAAPQDVVFITGSLYLVGEARALLVQ
ncbi:MAG: cyanophycin synthetase, partial [Bryobacteraceae bacterium]